MVSTIKDVTIQYNIANTINLDVDGWDYIIAQFIGVTGTISFAATNDGGAVTGETAENPASAQNWVGVLGTNQATGTTASSVATGSLFKFSSVAKYLQFAGTANITKLLVLFVKIQ